MRLVGVLNFGNSSSLCSKAKRSCSQSFPHALSASPTVGSTACTCVLGSLYSPWDDALPHWRCPSLQQVDCERSAASTIFSQRLLLNVQNLSKMQHFGRVRSVSCHTSCESVVHCLPAPLSESSHQAYTSSHAVNDRTSFSSAKVVTLRESPLSLANNTKTWAPRQCQRRAICPQQPNIERRRCWSILEAGFLSLIPSPYAKRPENGGSALDAPRFAGRKSGRWSSSPRHAPFRTEAALAHRFAPKWSALTAPWPRPAHSVTRLPEQHGLARYATIRSDPWKLNERRMRMRCMKHGRDRSRKRARARSERACRWFWNETWNF